MRKHLAQTITSRAPIASDSSFPRRPRRRRRLWPSNALAHLDSRRRTRTPTQPLLLARFRPMQLPARARARARQLIKRRT